MISRVRVEVFLVAPPDRKVPFNVPYAANSQPNSEAARRTPIGSAGSDEQADGGTLFTNATRTQNTNSTTITDHSAATTAALARYTPY